MWLLALPLMVAVAVYHSVKGVSELRIQVGQQRLLDSLSYTLSFHHHFLPTPHLYFICTMHDSLSYTVSFRHHFLSTLHWYGLDHATHPTAV